MSKTVVSSDNAPAAIGPYSPGIQTGNMVFLSGQLGIDPATGKMPEGVEAQAKQSLAKMCIRDRDCHMRIYAQSLAR